jgi:hypothetical protein
MIRYKARLVWPVLERMCLRKLAVKPMSNIKHLHKLWDVLSPLADGRGLAQVEALRLAEELHQ